MFENIKTKFEVCPSLLVLDALAVLARLRTGLI
jgi:hypothetical protein